MEKEIRLMKGNEALAIAAIRYGADAYFGYPITLSSRNYTKKGRLCQKLNRTKSLKRLHILL